MVRFKLNRRKWAATLSTAMLLCKVEPVCIYSSFLLFADLLVLKDAPPLTTPVVAENWKRILCPLYGFREKKCHPFKVLEILWTKRRY
ncbi:hypothetical protein GUJ93_ZPchr0013g36369 [Zizania palustris]|uniref:Uncharacterized protein n=1 Tax=Zizania palustris TaxID=103762 RepID=A0A8J5WUK6_ZIZPA|nr:hypothetical protein GUJ93_ZPchr0013g36369 [Zizania palustris]